MKQSDKSNSEESDTEVSLCRADKRNIIMTYSVSNKLSKQQKKKCYKKKLRFKRIWENVYPWLRCENTKVGMFYTLGKKWGRPPSSEKGEWTTRGIVGRNHIIELLKQHGELNGTKTH